MSFQKNDILLLETSSSDRYVGVVQQDDPLRVRWWIAPMAGGAAVLGEASLYPFPELCTRIGSLEDLDLSL